MYSYVELCCNNVFFVFAGHEMVTCTTEDQEPGRYCKQCGEITFQPNKNKFGDDCRLRQVPLVNIEHILKKACSCSRIAFPVVYKTVQVGKDQEKAQSERDSHSKNRGGKKPN